MFTEEKIQQILQQSEKIEFTDLKISYMILKPNAAKHYDSIIKEVEANRFIILDQYAIFDYETVNMALHRNQENALKYIIPISRMYYDFYGNYAVLLLIAKKDIMYEDFCLQVLRLKKYLRAKFELSYISYAFDTSELGEDNLQQKLLIISKEGREVKKDSMNKEGTFMVFNMNEIHSPDGAIESLVSELSLLIKMGILSEENIIPKTIIRNMSKYGTFSFLIDL